MKPSDSTIRVVVARAPRGDWQVFRQPQWMAHVRRHPSAAAQRPLFLEIDEAQLGALRTRCAAAGALDADALRGGLRDLGAVEIHPPAGL